jgi:hypothetical protein
MIEMVKMRSVLVPFVASTFCAIGCVLAQSPGPTGLPLPPENTRMAADISLVCPTQVAPMMPTVAVQEGISSVVKAKIHVQSGVVRGVDIIDGLTIFHESVKQAMMQYKCKIFPDEYTVVQEFDFKNEKPLAISSGIAPRRVKILAVCPRQVAPEMPRKAVETRTTGVVKAQIHVKGDVIQSVEILSGPEIFHAAVKASMMKYKCVTNGTEVVATQEFNFKID